MAAWYIWIPKTLFVEHSRQVKIFASRIFGIIVRNAHKLVRAFLFLSNHSTWGIGFSFTLAREQALVTATPVLRTIHIILEIFVANLNIALGGNPFVFNGEPRLNVWSLLERGLTCIFLQKSDTFSNRVIITVSKTGESEWRNLVNLGWLWQCNFFGMYINCCYFCVRFRPKNFLSLSFFLSFFFIVPRWRLGRPVKTFDNSWKDACHWEGMWPRSLGGWGWSLIVLSQLRMCTHENKSMFVFFKSLRYYGE